MCLSLRVSSIRTRIKTFSQLRSVSLKRLWEYLPLEQGLRQVNLQDYERICSLRVSSIRTRIKTCNLLGYRNQFMCTALRVSSIRTRIKTPRVPSSGERNALWEYLPLEQGLRQCLNRAALHIHVLWEYLPLKQGLRLCPSCCYLNSITSESIFH